MKLFKVLRVSYKKEITSKWKKSELRSNRMKFSILPTINLRNFLQPIVCNFLMVMLSLINPKMPE